MCPSPVQAANSALTALVSALSPAQRGLLLALVVALMAVPAAKLPELVSLLRTSDPDSPHDTPLSSERKAS